MALTDKQRAQRLARMLVMRHSLGFTHKQIAQLCGLSHWHVRSLLSTAEFHRQYELDGDTTFDSLEVEYNCTPEKFLDQRDFAAYLHAQISTATVAHVHTYRLAMGLRCTCMDRFYGSY